MSNGIVANATMRTVYSHLIAIATILAGDAGGIRPQAKDAGTGKLGRSDVVHGRRHDTTGLGTACMGGLSHRPRRVVGRGRGAAGQGRAAAARLVRPAMGAGARRRWPSA